MSSRLQSLLAPPTLLAAPTWRARCSPARMTAIFALLVLSACTGTRVRATETTPLPRVLALSKPFNDRTYRLVAGDTLTTRCYFTPQLDDEVQVRPDGNISLSLIGELKGAGKTAAELSADITKGYAQYFLKSTAVVIAPPRGRARAPIRGSNRGR